MSDRRRGRWSDVPWVLVTSAQGGLMVALPTLLGLAIGYWLDRRFGTLPWISVVFTLIGAVIGPVMLYRWVTAIVRRRMAERADKGEEKPE